MSIADYAELKILDHALGTTSWTMPTGCYVKLHLGDPGEAGTSNPAVEVTRAVASFGAASAGVATSDADIDWTNVSTTEDYTHVSLWDAATAGNCIWSGPLDATINATATDDFTIPSGDLTVTLG